MKTVAFKRHIGIDPDIDKNGFAMIEGETHALANLTFWELYDTLRDCKVSTLVIIEAGWLNKGNYHLHPRDNLRTASAKGRHIGMNHQVGILIEEMCKYLNMPYKLIRPTKSKVKDAKLFNKITGWDGRSNQEQRDAMMLIYGLKQGK